jgi:hypothetical protein
MRTLCALLLCTNVALGASVETSPAPHAHSQRASPSPVLSLAAHPGVSPGSCGLSGCFTTCCSLCWCQILLPTQRGAYTGTWLRSLPKNSRPCRGSSHGRSAGPTRTCASPHPRVITCACSSILPDSACRHRRRHPDLTIRLLTVRCLGRWSEMEIETARCAQAV